MSLYIYGAWLATAAVGEAGTVTEIMSQGASLSNLAPAAIWATVALISVIGLVRLYWDKKKDDEDLKTIIKDTTAAISTNTATLEKLNQSIQSCPKK